MIWWDIGSLLDAEIGAVTTMGLHMENSARLETTVLGFRNCATNDWRSRSSSVRAVLSPTGESLGPNFNLFGTYWSHGLLQKPLPFFRVLAEIEHPSYSLPRHPSLYEAPPSTAVASSGFLIVVQTSLPDAPAPTAEAQSVASVAEVSSHLQNTIPERKEGDISQTLERILDPSSPPSATLLSLFALAAFFASNNSLQHSQADAFLTWIIDHGYTAFLTWFMKIQTPTVHAFAKVVLDSAIRINNTQVLETLLESGVKLNNKLYEIASIGNASLTQRILFDTDPAYLATTNMGARLFLKFVSDRQYDLAQFLLGLGVSVDASALDKSPSPGTALYRAVERQDIPGVKFLLEAGASVNRYYSNWNHYLLSLKRHTVLGYAVYLGNVEIAALLLEYKADIFAEIEGNSIFEWASLRRRSVFDRLLKDRVEREEIGFFLMDLLDAANRGGHALAAYIANQPEGVTPHQLEQALEEAIIEKHLMAVTTLLQHGVDPNGPTLRARPLATALDEAYFDDRCVELLLQHQAHVGYTGLLEKLATTGARNLLRMLLTRQIDLGEREKALVVACSPMVGDHLADLPSVAIIMDSGLDIDTPGLPRNPLQTAAANEDEDVVLLLIGRGANPNAPPYPQGGRTALQAALEACKSDRIAKILLRHGAEASAPPALLDGLTVLEAFCHNAAAVDNARFCDTLLDAGATVNRPGGEPSSVLHGVIQRGWHEVLGRFLEPSHGAITNHMWYPDDENRWDQDWTPCTPTQLAASLGDLKAVKLLLDHGTDVNEAPANESGRTSLQAASLLTPGPKKTELIQFLLDRGANINAAPAISHGVTALQGAAIAGDLMLAQLLITRGANVNAWPSFENGRTAIEAAAEHGRLDMIQLLLNAGATGDPMRGTGFELAIKLAERNGHFAVVSILK
ncbi:ankyrin repeat-containing domain protein [Chaetomium sp. MPI-CAGE-AT-0009]|nr:ankyrin repeat-containing domain protein [Chaetomium sp. MPI-CAGE-AT-0009]